MKHWFKRNLEKLTDGEFLQAIKEALSPRASKEFVRLGTKQVQIRFLHWSIEDQVEELIADGITRGLETKGVTTLREMIRHIKKEIYRALPMVMATIFDEQGITLEWLNDKRSRVTTIQMIDALTAQMAKNEVSARLGELLSSGVLEGFLKRILPSTSTPQAEQPNTP